jgi:hypothetical protein
MVKKLIQEAWNGLCLHGRPWNTSLYDHLSFEAAREGMEFNQYVKEYGITKHPIRIDVVHVAWMAMGVAYNRFSKEAMLYDEVVEFREQFGERTLFGLLREYIVTGTGLKYSAKPERLKNKFLNSQLFRH